MPFTKDDTTIEEFGTISNAAYQLTEVDHLHRAAPDVLVAVDSIRLPVVILTTQQTLQDLLPEFYKSSSLGSAGRSQLDALTTKMHRTNLS